MVDLVYDPEDYERIEKVRKHCDGCEKELKCGHYCEEAQKVRDGNGY